MPENDRFLRQLYQQTSGRIDRTVHVYLHVAKPLALSEDEMRVSTDTLLAAGLIEADPMFDRLIRLTPRGVATYERPMVDGFEGARQWNTPGMEAAGSPEIQLS